MKHSLHLIFHNQIGSSGCTDRMHPKIYQLIDKKVMKALIKWIGLTGTAFIRKTAAAVYIHGSVKFFLPHQFQVDFIGHLIGQHIPAAGRIHILFITPHRCDAGAASHVYEEKKQNQMHSLYFHRMLARYLFIFTELHPHAGETDIRHEPISDHQTLRICYENIQEKACVISFGIPLISQ